MTLVDEIAQCKRDHPEITHVFWDYFDTVIHRTVEPEYVKRLSAARMTDALGLQTSAEEIYRMRARVERKLCVANAEAGRDLEFRFMEMADALFDELNQNDEKGEQHERIILPRETFSRLFYDLEVAIELQVQRLVPAVADAIRSVKQSGLRNIIVSDFYLPAEAERTFLSHLGLVDQFESVIVSSTDCYTKTGRLFARALEQLHLRPEQVLVVGDHPAKDRDPAEKLGLHVILINDYTRQKSVYATMLKHHLNQKALETALATIVNDGRVPFAEFVLTLYHFIARLSVLARKDGVKHLSFLSREGEFLKKLFDHYQSRLLPQQRVGTNYLIASRRSTFLPVLRDINKEDFGTLLEQYFHLSGEEFMQNLGFTRAETATVQTECSYDLGERQYPFAWSRACHALFRSPTFNRLYEEKRRSQKQELLSYLASLGFDPDTGQPFFLVDVGWRGTIQDHLFGAFDKSVPVHGYYVGLFHPRGLNWRNTKDGVLFTEHPRQSPFFQVYFENRTLFEILLGASHGSPSGYADREPIIEDKPEEQEMYERTVKPLQDKFLELFDQICDVMARTHFSAKDLEKFFARRHARMVFDPTREELELFSRLRHFENFGLFEWSTFSDERLSPTKWFTNVFRLFRNPVGIIFGGFWPALTIRHLRIPLLSWAYRTFRMWRVF